MASSYPPLLLKMLLLLFLIDLFASKRKELLALTGISSVFLLPLDSHYVTCFSFHEVECGIIVPSLSFAFDIRRRRKIRLRGR